MFVSHGMWAAALAHAEAQRSPIAPLTESGPDVTLHDAYRIQEINTQRRLAAGERVIGHKVGLTSVAMQRQLGVDEPDFGALLSTMDIPAGGVIRKSELIAPRAEAEIAFVLGEDLSGPGVTLEQARAAVSHVLLAIEVIDSRIADWRIRLADTVADNASSARVIAGDPVTATPELLATLASEPVELLVDGEIAGKGLGADVLGGPLRAVAWLARTLHGLGSGLRAGELVLAGAVHASVPLRAGTRLEVRSSHLPALHAGVGE